MKGVVLAGGRGTRLRPMTHVINKHLLPVYDEPMIFHPVRTLLDNGIDDIMVVSGAEHLGRYVELLEDEFDADFSYRVQKEPKGIAHAVSLAEDFVDDTFAVVLGDNIVIDDLQQAFADFEEEDGAKIFLKDVDQPARYGIADIQDGQVVDLEEKPDNPATSLAVIGLYLYHKDVFDKIREIEPSERGELEITDVNQLYLEEDRLTYGIVHGEWIDAGTPEGLYTASTFVRDHKQ